MVAEGPLPGEPEDHIVTAMGFTFAHPEIHVAIVGSKNPRHMQSNIATLPDALSVEPAMVDELHRRFADLDDGWRQLT